MKTKPLPSPCIVQSVTYTPERRILTFTGAGRSPGAAPSALRRRKMPFRLKIEMAPEAASSFEPSVLVRSQTKS